eukprot:TRINITY_DN6108_c0_g1_i2.p6 TRINITY_DN6108_c0_g1~~TRINITY_DN6108_c0_g1_i2.p6  ORF type:complete len:114 (-),score=8.16 TRINITY_DN6108_c0_g1_i2:172-513(-)
MIKLWLCLNYGQIFEQWPDFGCEGIKVQRAHQPTSQCQGKKKKKKLCKNSLIPFFAKQARQVQFFYAFKVNCLVLTINQHMNDTLIKGCSNCRFYGVFIDDQIMVMFKLWLNF